MRTGCCGIGANDNMCAGRVGVPYPAGLWDRFHRGGKGGIIEISGGICCHCCGGYGGPQGFCMINGFWGGGQNMNSVNEQIMRGVGGMSSMVVDGQSCCGQRGGPSAIWISYC
jgi:hypothetical protein